jgi:3'(2'), 5'-bisphosphate nucleotidase
MADAAAEERRQIEIAELFHSSHESSLLVITADYTALAAGPIAMGMHLTESTAVAQMPRSTPDRELRTMTKATPSPLLASILELALEAGRAVMAVYDRDPQARMKSDATPLTDADVASEGIILAGLRKIAPEIPVISEESASPRLDVSGRFFLVDPLDGTREFLSRNGEFTVNIALIDKRAPVAGVIFAPALPRLYWAEGSHAFETTLTRDGSIGDHRRLRTAPQHGQPQRALASRSHCDSETSAWLRAAGVIATSNIGSSLKFCLLAAGEADVYPRFGRTMEWDTAAGHAILAAAGGSVIATDGTPLTYGKLDQGFANPYFIARA